MRSMSLWVIVGVFLFGQFQAMELSSSVLDLSDMNEKNACSLLLRDRARGCGCGDVESVIMSFFSSQQDLEAIVAHFASLQELRRMSSNKFVDVSVIGKLWNLRRLDLSGLYMPVIAEQLEQIALGCPYLWDLSVASLVSSKQMFGEKPFSKLGLCEQLRYLNISGNYIATSELIEIFTRCKRLEYVNMSDCNEVLYGDVSSKKFELLLNLLPKLPLLQELDVSFTDVTGNMVVALFLACPWLHVVHVAREYRRVDKILGEIVSCPAEQVHLLAAKPIQIDCGGFLLPQAVQEQLKAVGLLEKVCNYRTE